MKTLHWKFIITGQSLQGPSRTFSVMLHVFQVVSVKSSVFIEVIPMKPVRMYFACMSTSAFWLNSC